MRRRDFAILLAGTMGGRPSAVRAQQNAMPVYRIGFLRNGPPPETFMGGFRQGLREFGYVEGQNIRIEYGLAGNADQLPDAAAELVHRNVDVIIASGTPPVVAAKNATRTIPIVFVAAIDPIATGIVASLARPGGNVTGFALIEADLMGKRLELLETPNTSGRQSSPRRFKSSRSAMPAISNAHLQRCGAQAPSSSSPTCFSLLTKNRSSNWLRAISCR